eukprot:g5084.t1
MNINISKNQLKWMGLALATVGVSTMNYVRRRAMEPMIIIGITGTIGAGKGTVVDYLKKHHRFAHFSARKFLYKLIDEKGLERNRDNLTSTANALRQKDGPAAVTINLFREAEKHGKRAIIESVRTEGEIVNLRSRGVPFTLLAVDADQRVRYDRIYKRASATDSVSFETFKAQEKREMTSTDPTKQNLKRCMELADFTIRNDGTEADFQDAIETFICKLLAGNGDLKQDDEDIEKDEESSKEKDLQISPTSRKRNVHMSKRGSLYVTDIDNDKKYRIPPEKVGIHPHIHRDGRTTTKLTPDGPETEILPAFPPSPRNPQKNGK